MNINPKKITQIFDEISSYYDKMNNFISLGTHYFIKKLALKSLNIRSNSYVLDLCCGTGDFTRIISKMSPKSRVIGLDSSIKMLNIAMSKNPHKVFIHGDCTNLPFKNNEFDYITIGFGLRNVQDRQKAICEIHRTLKTGGKFLHLDFGKHNFSFKLFKKIVLFIVKVTGLNPCNYEYLLKSINDYPEPDELIREFEKSGFKCCEKKSFLFGVVCAQILSKI